MASLNPTGLEQEMLELINQMRLSPETELSRLLDDPNAQTLSSPDENVTGALNFFNVNADVLRAQFAALTPSAPLAWSPELLLSADNHNQLMIQFDEQSHNLPGEASLRDRFTNAGYDPFSSISENVYAFADSVFHGHAGFVIDWGFTPTGIQEPAGHRNSIMNPNYQEIGISVIEENDPNTDVGPFVVTQHFGGRSLDNPYLLGVVFDDNDNDNFYDNGEGLGNVDITIAGDNGTFTTTSLDAGGYQLQVPAGDYQITFSGNGISQPFSQNVTIGSDNVKVDLNTDNITSGNGGNNGGNTGGDNGGNTGDHYGGNTGDNTGDNNGGNTGGTTGGNDILDTRINRFQNKNIPGTFLFAKEDESQTIRSDFPNFQEEGTAFHVATEPGDDLVRINRFQNKNVPGTFLFATEEESVSIRRDFTNFEEEGIAFYVYGADANKGEDYYRLQNSQQPGTYIFVNGQEKDNILRDFPQFIPEGVAFEVV